MEPSADPGLTFAQLRFLLLTKNGGQPRSGRAVRALTHVEGRKQARRMDVYWEISGSDSDLVDVSTLYLPRARW